VHIKRVFAASFAAVVLAAVAVGSASAGEVTGKGGPTPVAEYVMKSICAFSGYNDGEPPPGRTAAHVQSWGQETKEAREFLASIGLHPGDACNGHRGLLASE
jgi:hypothetical protein